MIIGLVIIWSVGLLISVLGIVNMSGNISSLHSYHRSRVREEDVKPFGKLVGLGLLLVGIAVIACGALLLAFELTGNSAFVTVGVTTLFIGIVAGSAVSFCAIKKYNGGIF